MGLPPDLQQHLGALRRAEEVFVKPLLGVLAALDYMTEVQGRIHQVEEQKTKAERELTDLQEKLRDYREQIEKFPSILRTRREEFNGQVNQARIEADKDRARIKTSMDELLVTLGAERDRLAQVRREQSQAETRLATVKEELAKVAQLAG